MPLGARDLLLIIRAKDQASRVIHDVGRSVDNMNRNMVQNTRMTGQEMTRLGQAVFGVGLAITAAGLAGVAFFVSATKAAMEYDKQARLTLTQVDQMGASLERIKEIGREVASEVGAPFEQMQKGLYDIFSSMDVKVEGSKAILTSFAKAAVAGNTDIQTAGRATIAVMNGFGQESYSAGKALDIQFQIVRKGVITYEELASTIGRAIPSAVRAGQSFEELGGMIAFMTRNGLSAAMAATGAARALDLLSNPKFGKNMKQLGIDVLDTAGNFRPMSEVMLDLKDKLIGLPLGERSQALKDLTMGAGGTIQAMRFLNLAVADADGSLQKLTGTMYNAQGELERAYNIMKETPLVQIQLLKNAFQILRTEIGDQFLPMVGKLAAWGVRLIEGFRGLDDTTKKWIVGIAAVTSVLTVLIGVITMASGALLMMRGAWLQLVAMNTTTFISGWIGSLGKFSVAMHGSAAATGMLSTALRLIPVVAVFALLVHELHDYKQGVDEAEAGTKDFIQMIMNTASGPVEAMSQLRTELSKQKDVLAALKPEWYEFVSPEKAKRIGETKASIELLEKAIEGNVEAVKKARAETDGYNLVLQTLGKETADQFNDLAGMSEEAFERMGEAAKESAEAMNGALDGMTDVFAKFGDQAVVTGEEIRAFYAEQASNMNNFADNIEEALRRGLDPEFILRALKAGPEQAASVIAAAVADSSNATIDIFNNGIAATDEGTARLEALIADAVLEVEKLDQAEANPKIDLDVTAAKEKYDGVIRDLDDINRQRPIPIIDANNNPQRERYMNTMGQLAEINRQRPLPVVDANNNPIRERYTDSMGKLNEVGRQRPHPIMNATNSDLSGKTTDSMNRLNEVGRQRPNPVVTASTAAATGPIAYVLSQLWSIVSRTWTAVVRSVFGGMNGGYFPGTSSFAGGAEDHRAQIAHAGAWRVWAEPETGGEAYIPLADSKRAQSEKILGLVANRFGYGLTAMANGALMDGLRSSVPSINLSTGRMTSPALSGSSGASQAPTIYQGDTFNIYARSDSPEEVVAAISFRKKTRGW